MCNRAKQKLSWQEYIGIMQREALQIPAHQTELDLMVSDPAKDYEVGIGDKGAIMVPAGDQVELATMKFGKPQPGRGPLFNFRSDGRNFSDSKRCIMPVDGFFEFTGTKSPKAKHLFTVPASRLFGIASIWFPAEGNEPASFAMLTTQPGPDIKPFHDRQIVILTPDKWGTWLFDNTRHEDLFRPLPAATFAHQLVRPGKD
ncbi:SOS response-associated peptidase family protein [Asticcacaulis solisilvae]|uniref:SOS response-associated peptidase family protein n=1 Tax=Asticcacaulis solisilvae TaxID=1217274 RepID=UPI003FD81EF1